MIWGTEHRVMARAEELFAPNGGKWATMIDFAAVEHGTSDDLEASVAWTRAMASSGLSSDRQFSACAPFFGGSAPRRVSSIETGAQPNGGSGGPSIGADVRVASFSNGPSHLPPGDAIISPEISASHRQDPSLKLVIQEHDETSAQGMNTAADMSGNDRFVMLSTCATSLTVGNFEGYRSAFTSDRTDNTVQRITASAKRRGGGETSGCAFSANGNYIFLASATSYSISGDTNNVVNLFVHDAREDQTENTSVGAADLEAFGPSSEPVASISDDGRYVARSIRPTNLIEHLINQAGDIFVRGRATDANSRRQS